MKRAITTLASLAVLATAGPIGGASAAVTVAGQPSKFSDRFLTSLEEVDADAVVETNIMDGEETTNALIEERDGDRRRLSWWSLALMILQPCDPKKGHCPHPPPADNNAGSGNGSGATTTYTSASDAYDSNKANIVPGTAPFAAIITALAAAVAALLALAVAAKRRRKPQYHQLRGSVKQRMNLFSGFANRCFEDRAASGLQDAISEEGLQVV
mmetsp:Transcript_24396/g.40256  ORF Transcript_24396/g.40256 Transcript_24396/m.40256 type:complete len:213 (+) Transcript_24396:76-714(+)